MFLGLLGVPRVPTVPRVPRVPGVRRVARVAMVPSVPRVPRVPRVPSVPRVPGLPTVSRFPRVPRVPRDPGVPWVPRVCRIRRALRDPDVRRDRKSPQSAIWLYTPERRLAIFRRPILVSLICLWLGLWSTFWPGPGLGVACRPIPTPELRDSPTTSGPFSVSHYNENVRRMAPL